MFLYHLPFVTLWDILVYQDAIWFDSPRCSIACKYDESINKLNFVTGIADDIIIWEQTDWSDPDQHLSDFLHLKWQNKLKLNYDKWQ